MRHRPSHWVTLISGLKIVLKMYDNFWVRNRKSCPTNQTCSTHHKLSFEIHNSSIWRVFFSLWPKMWKTIDATIYILRQDFSKYLINKFSRQICRKSIKNVRIRQHFPKNRRNWSNFIRIFPEFLKNVQYFVPKLSKLS